MIKIEDLKPYEKNPRLISKKQFELLGESLDKLGDLSGVVFNRRNGRLVGGHMRIKHLESIKNINKKIVEHKRSETADSQGTVCVGVLVVENGDEKLSYTYREVDWDDETHEEAMIKANRLGGEWDTDILANNWEESKLEEWGFDKSELSGWGDPESGETEGDDEKPEFKVDALPITIKGDIYDLGGHRLLCGDSTIPTDVEKLNGDYSPIIMATDPPYGVEYDPEWREGADLGVGERSTGKVKNDDRADWEEAYSLFEGDIVYIWHAAKYTHIVAKNIEDCGFELISQIIWVKQHFALSRGDYHWQHEPLWYAVRKGKNHNWQGSRDQSTTWDIKNNNSFGNSEKEDTWGHGTQKPLECMLRPIENNTKAGDAVYDPFGGSGTTLIACEKIDRKCVMMEIDERYCDMIVKRYIDFCKKNDRDFSVSRNGKECHDFDKFH